MHFFHSLYAMLCEMAPFVLLGFILAGLLHEFVKPSVMSRHLSGHGLMPTLKAAALGIPLPLCSCSVLPTAVSLRRGGASRGATTSFLIATPQTGVDSIAATYSLLGLPFALIRPIAALVGAVAGGWTVDRCVPETADKLTDGDTCAAPQSAHRPLWRRIIAAVRYGLVDMVGDMGKWLIIGLIVAAAITAFVPDTLFTSLARYPILAMLAMVIVAVPMYVCATGSIPIALALMLKGLTPGVAFVLLMAGPAANFASLLILGRAYGRKATAIYVASVVVTAIVFGLIIDYLLPGSWFALSPQTHAMHAHGGEGASVIQLMSAALLVILLAVGMLAHRHSHNHSHSKHTDMNTSFHIDGMACGHCKARVEEAIRAIPGVEDVEVSLADKSATVSGSAAPEQVVEAVTRAGYEIRPA